MRLSFSSLRTRLIFLVLIAFIPWWSFTVHSGVERYKHDRGEAENRALELARANRTMIFSFSLSGLIGMLALLATRFIGKISISDPVKALLGMTKRISNGDLSARSGFSRRRGELGELSEAFDRMANSLLHREEEQRRMEEALQQSKEHFRILTENALDLITVLRTDGTITYQSPPVKQVLGYEPEGVLGRKITDFIHPDDALAMMDAIESAARQPGSVQSREIRVRHSDGSWRLFEGAGKSIVDESGATRIIITGRDVTGRRSLEDQLFQSQKLEAVARLTGGVAHDFNNMLTVIIGYSDSLLMSGKVDDSTRSHIQEIKKAGERAASLTRQLLAFSRRQVLKPEALNLNFLINGIEKMLKRCPYARGMGELSTWL